MHHKLYMSREWHESNAQVASLFLPERSTCSDRGTQPIPHERRCETNTVVKPRTTSPIMLCEMLCEILYVRCCVRFYMWDAVWDFICEMLCEILYVCEILCEILWYYVQCCGRLVLCSMFICDIDFHGRCVLFWWHAPVVRQEDVTLWCDQTTS